MRYHSRWNPPRSAPLRGIIIDNKRFTKEEIELLKKKRKRHQPNLKRKRRNKKRRRQFQKKRLVRRPMSPLRARSLVLKRKP